jgi:carbon-monoxide dehydrogenase small subunit
LKVHFELNGRPMALDVPGDRRVVDLLREDLHLTGTKEACGSGECGACTVLVNGESRLSCLMPAAQLAGKRVMTIEGVGTDRTLHVLQQAFVAHGAVQCGFCTPGMILAALHLLKENPRPTRREIREGISGNLCRCTGYQMIVDAIEAAAGEIGHDRA